MAVKNDRAADYIEMAGNCLSRREGEELTATQIWFRCNLSGEGRSLKEFSSVLDKVAEESEMLEKTAEGGTRAEYRVKEGYLSALQEYLE